MEFEFMFFLRMKTITTVDVAVNTMYEIFAKLKVEFVMWRKDRKKSVKKFKFDCLYSLRFEWKLQIIYFSQLKVSHLIFNNFD